MRKGRWKHTITRIRERSVTVVCCKVVVMVLCEKSDHEIQRIKVGEGAAMTKAGRGMGVIRKEDVGMSVRLVTGVGLVEGRTGSRSAEVLEETGQEEEKEQEELVRVRTRGLLR